MLTPVSAARSFSEFHSNPVAVATDDSLYAPHAHAFETLEQASYFDTLMRLRGRRAAPRRAFRPI